MSASGFRRAAAIAGGLIATTGTYSMTASPSASQPLEAATSARGAHSHVLLLSVDGMHQSDLRWYLAHHPRSAAARVVYTTRPGRSPRTAATTPKTAMSPRWSPLRTSDSPSDARPWKPPRWPQRSSHS
jgi:hypothetical protein